MSDSGRSKQIQYGQPTTDPEEMKATTGDFEIFDPELILGYYRRLEHILTECPLDLYAASTLKQPWPHRLQRADECAPASYWRSPKRILDSAITAPELSNRDVLREAITKHATAVVAKDYLPFEAYHALYEQDRLSEKQLRVVEALEREYEDNVAATTASIEAFLDEHDPDRHPPAFIPLHPPYDEHYREVAPFVKDSHVDERYMLGGLKDASSERRIEELLAFREVAGPEPTAHGLGWGLSTDLVRLVREEPELLDSVDNSTTTQIRNGQIVDADWTSHSGIATVSGQFANTINGGWELAMLKTQMHRLSPFHDDLDDADAREPDQSGLGDFEGGVPAND